MDKASAKCVSKNGNIYLLRLSSNRLSVSLFVFALEGTQINSVAPGSSMMQNMSQYPSLGQVSHPYETSQAGMELNKYASLKAVGKAVLTCLGHHHFLLVSNL